MEISKMKSNLIMDKLYFSKCSIERLENVGSGELNADLQRRIKPCGKHVFEVELDLTINKEDINLQVIAKATFTFESDDYSMEEDLIKTNTVAIMFPFIRSQVTLLTTQPEMTPIVLPPINTAKYFD
ncbi:MAG: protein-export chaperone SecB [Bacillota bacterium]|nr:protein-export chaperone SecB [Bacillota bacterium]